ncbi:hypothetical protein VTJ49DRAFT_7146 [Mycothermus thermophilus]|uniref:Proteasome assembly chaperone 3 n=1 Tax=Humicola insolens TaxID=85995 RepID=A0ABR3VKD3_HUMIN
MNGESIRPEPFPAPSKRTIGTVNGVETEVASISFSDKIMITVSQGGRLGQWIASHLALRDPNDKRTLLLGLGMEKVEGSRDAFFDLLELVIQVL